MASNLCSQGAFVFETKAEVFEEPPANTRCFFDLSVDGVGLGRLVIELYQHDLPKTCKNFISLCKGWDFMGEKLHYKGCRIHEIRKKDKIVVGGDILRGNGSGGFSVYGPTFPSEKRRFGFTKPGMIAMLSWGPDKNHSQFFIVLDPDETTFTGSIPFGCVVEGLPLLRKLLQVDDHYGLPLSDIRITNCGQL